MLATRSLRFAAARYVNPSHCIWSPSIRIPTTLQAPSTICYTRPLVAAYSKDIKSGVLFSSSCSFLPSNNIHKCNFTTSLAPNTTFASSNSPTPLTEKSVTSDNPSQPSISDKPSSTSSSSTTIKTSSPSASHSTQDVKTETEKSCTGSIGETGVKLPSKDQVESFVFKSLVYLWDFAYYVFCLCRKLVETYVFNNSTVQYYWKQLLKRMEDARKDLKSK